MNRVTYLIDPEKQFFKRDRYTDISAIENLHNRIDLEHIPFMPRGSRIMLFSTNNELYIRLAERWKKVQDKLGHYRKRYPIISHFKLLDA